MNRVNFNENRNIIYERVRIARENLGISQSQLAAKLQTFGISIDQQSVSRIEKNLRIVRDYEFAYLCKILKVDAVWLLGDIE